MKYDEYKELADAICGPAVVKPSAVPFEPVNKNGHCAQMSASKSSVSVFFQNEAGQIVNRYIKDDGTATHDHRLPDPRGMIFD